MPTPVFLVMPEWQGSSSSRAMRIAEGANLLREDLPVAARVDVEVPLEAGDSMGTPVARLSSLISARDAARAALSAAAGRIAAGNEAAEHNAAEQKSADHEAGEDRADPDPRVPIVLGGDCASSLAGLERAAAAPGSLAVLWFDAHPDLQHPSTSPSGAASGMTLRHALGDGSPDLSSAHPIDPARLLLVAAREINPEEAGEIERRNIAKLVAAPDADPEAFAAQVVAALGDADRLYIHLDLDVLDPAEFAAVHTSVPFGLSVAQLAAAIRAAVAAVPLAGAAICEFAPADEAAAAEDQPTVLRLLAALTSGMSRAGARS